MFTNTITNLVISVTLLTNTVTTYDKAKENKTNEVTVTQKTHIRFKSTEHSFYGDNFISLCETKPFTNYTKVYTWIEVKPIVWITNNLDNYHTQTWIWR